MGKACQASSPVAMVNRLGTHQVTVMAPSLRWGQVMGAAVSPSLHMASSGQPHSSQGLE